jgi:hypothetical protein
VKVRITFDITEEALVGINVIDGGPIKPASRDDARQFITNLVEAKLESLDAGFRKHLQKYADEFANFYTEPKPEEASEM